MTLGSGQIIVGSSTGVPTAETLTAGAGIAITSSLGSITISSTAPTSTGGSGGGGLTLISTQTVTGSPASTITFSSIPQTYSHLKLIIIGRNTDTGGNGASPERLGMLFNGDTTVADYPNSNFWWSGGAGVNNSGSAYGWTAADINPSSSTIPSTVEITIYNYAQAATPISFASNTASFSRAASFSSGTYTPTTLAPVTSLTLSTMLGNFSLSQFAVGTQVWLYGF